MRQTRSHGLAAALLALAGTLLLPCAPLAAQDPVPDPVPEPPLIGLAVDEAEGTLTLRLPADRLDTDLLWMNTLATGLGVSGGPGLDRGQLGRGVVVRFERRGNRVYLVRDNWDVRAPGADAAGVRAAREAFPRSVLAAFPIDEETADGTLLLDATAFFLSDTYGVAASLRRGNAGSFRVDRARSWVDASRTKAFPRNAEVHVVLTFASDAPGGAARAAAPDGGAVTMELHHSLAALPDDEYRPRRYDPRAGYFGTAYFDFTEGFDGDYRAGYINRWRLVPSDTAAYARGELVDPVEPIVYYLDPAIPEPYRSAFREGGLWWARVFESVGFRDAFRVEDLPAGVDPMDARYNLIWWIHRTGPGPSVGPSYADPRTGEIVRTVVRMDAWRSLIDYNIWAGTVPAFGDAGPDVDAETFTMARRRQHTAHEIGHTLGLAHNYIASAQGRESVMDYPFPLITLDSASRPVLADAYRDGAGGWDSLAIRYGYTWFASDSAEAAGLSRIVRDGIASGLRFVTDQDANAPGSIPVVTRWVEGATMIDAYTRTRDVRRTLVRAFDDRAIRAGEPLSLLNKRFAHVYLHHRYSLEGLIKTIGGMDYRYALRGDGQPPTTVVPADSQRAALRFALEALAPAELDVPDRVAALVPPSPPGVRTPTWIDGMAGPAFDHLTLAGGLATEIVAGLLHRERQGRLLLFHARDEEQLGPLEAMRALVERTWRADRAESERGRALQRVVQRVVVDELIALAGDARALPDVRAVAGRMLREIVYDIERDVPLDDVTRAHHEAVAQDVEAFEDGEYDPASRTRFPVIVLPWP